MDARQTDARKHHAEDARARSAYGNLVWEHRLLWLLLLAIIGLFGYHYFRGRVDRQLHAVLLQRLAERFPEHLIQLEQVHLQEGHAILIEGLRIALPTTDGPRDLVRVQRIVAKGPIHLLDLVQNRLAIEQVHLDGCELSLWPIDQQLWSIQTLGSNAPLPSSLPRIEIRTGLLRVGRTKPSEGELIFHDLRGRIQSKAEVGLEVDLTLLSSAFQNLRMQMAVSHDKQSWSVQGELQDVEISERLILKLPEPIQRVMNEARGLSGRANATFQARKLAGQELNYELRGDFRQGRLVHPRLPYLLENLEGEVFLRNSLLQLRNVVATNGDVRFAFEADVQDPFDQPRSVIQGKVTSLDLDQRLFQAIPSPLQAQWRKLSLAGVIDATVNLEYDRGQWKPQARIDCKNVSATADLFPYPLQGIRGTLHYANGILEGSDIRGSADGREVLGSIRLERASPKWLLDLQLSSEEWINIDTKLMSALTPLGEPSSKFEQFVRSLEPHGLVQLKNARFMRTAQNPTRLMKWLELGVHSGSIRYTGFSYPIFDIRGSVVVDNDVVLLKELEGRNDSGRIRCQGRCVTGPGHVEELQLAFDAQSVPLEEELQRALPLQVRELWNQLQPSGIIDNVQVKLERINPSQPLDIQVEISEAGLVDSQIGRSVSLRPIAIPYLLNDIACHIVYRPGVVDVLSMSGYHDSSQVKAEGTCRMQPSGRWSGVLNWLPQSRVIVDQSLIAALPEKLRQPLVSLDFRGPVNVGGWTYFVTAANTGEPIAQSWDLDLEVEDGKLRGGSIASGIRGSVRMKGEMTDRGPMVTGHFGIDSMAIRSIPVMGMKGKFAIEGEQLMFGREASSVVLPESPDVQFISSLADRSSVRLASSTSPREEDIQAKTLSGTLFAHGVGNLASGRIHLELHLNDADFQNLLLEIGQPTIQVNGRVFADAQLQGSMHNINTLSGNGIIRVRDADLYELPMMAKLFRLLSVRPPADGAFETADVEFQIDGDRFPLNKVALDGDVISLKGTGWTNMRKELHLDLFTYVGKRGQLAAMFGPLLSGNDSATLLRIEVDGSIENPKLKRSLPGLEMTLEQVFPEKFYEAPVSSSSR